MIKLASAFVENNMSDKTTSELLQEHLNRASELIREVFDSTARRQQKGPQLTIYKDFTFEASHVLPRHLGKCSRLHGHSWQLRVGVTGPISPESGFVLDYAVLKRVVQHNLLDVVDHAHLGEDDMENFLPNSKVFSASFGADFYPTSENLVIKFHQLLDEPLRNEGVELVYLELKETSTSGCIWRKYGA